jgi:hypothetical protein
MNLRSSRLLLSKPYAGRSSYGAALPFSATAQATGELHSPATLLRWLGFAWCGRTGHRQGTSNRKQ